MLKGGTAQQRSVWEFGGSWGPGKGPPAGLQRYYTHLSSWEVGSHKQGSKS